MSLFQISVHSEILSEAHKELLAQQWSKNKCFKEDINSARQQIDDAIKTIMLANHKSINHVQHKLYLGHNSFHTRCSKKKREQQELGDDQLPGGKGALLALAQQSSEEYKSISVEKKALIEEYTPYKGHKTFGVCATTKSKVNDITKTLKAIENEIHFIFFHLISLQHHTGAETMLYMTCRSINFPLCGVAFATKGVENFMGTVMHIDDHDLVSKMEGFAVQGMPLQIINNAPPKCEVQSKKSSILSCVTHYFCNIIACYLVMIEGWPYHIPFMNLSTVSSALLDLEMLLRMWESGSIFWNQLSEEEYKALHLKCDAKLNSGELIEYTCRTHSDKGTKNSQHAFKSAKSFPTGTKDETMTLEALISQLLLQLP
ncbi:hypothetical protein V8B97DRAFT_2026027 [Scleroderma yunnanense]